LLDTIRRLELEEDAGEEEKEDTTESDQISESIISDKEATLSKSERRLATDQVAEEDEEMARSLFRNHIRQDDDDDDFNDDEEDEEDDDEDKETEGSEWDDEDEAIANAAKYSSSEKVPDIIRTPADIYKKMASLTPSSVGNIQSNSTFSSSAPNNSKQIDDDDDVSIMKSNVVETEDLESMNPEDLDDYLFGREIANEYYAKRQAFIDRQSVALDGAPDELKNVC
jgi:hypothetical protein